MSVFQADLADRSCNNIIVNNIKILNNQLHNVEFKVMKFNYILEIIHCVLLNSGHKTKIETVKDSIYFLWKITLHHTNNINLN